jgi:TATA-box binding protein (TBP) (component of TFIID and TFIIIB)
LDCKVDLQHVANSARNAEYNPRVCIIISAAAAFSFTLDFFFVAWNYILHSIAAVSPAVTLILTWQRFGAAIMRIREPKTTALIFATGKMVCTGAKSEADSRLAARKAWKLLVILFRHAWMPILDAFAEFWRVTNTYLSSIAVRAYRPEARFPSSVQGNAFVTLIDRIPAGLSHWLNGFFWHMQDFKVQNIVGSCDLKFPIRLEGLALASGLSATVSL